MNELVQIALLILAVIIGGLIVVWLDAINQRKIIKMLLAFSGGFLLAIAFVHFLPELYQDHQSSIGIFVLLGFLIQLFLEYFSGGIEHGHVHHHADKKIPWMLFISLSIHSFIEGIPLTYPMELHHHHVGESSSVNSLLYGIILHQIPVAIALMTLLKVAGMNSLKSWGILLLFSIMTPLGLVFGYFWGGGINLQHMNYLLAIVIGMFLHISTTIIFETSENHKFNLIKLVSILFGVLLALMITRV